MNTVPMEKSSVGKDNKRAAPYQVMLVDDSSVIRGVLSRWLAADPAIEIVASVANGQAAVNSIDRVDPEIVVLDIEMPVMDGLTALPLILKAKPDVQVLMSSTLTSKNAKISLQAMSLGAADYIPKPSTNREVISSQSFQDEIIGKIKGLAESKRKQLGLALYKEGRTKNTATKPPDKLKKEINLHSQSLTMPKIIGIGSSTGGPQALLKFLSGIKDDLKLPVVITQHMPAAFTKILAGHLTKATGLNCSEATDGMILEGGRVYIAPGEYHMVVSKEDDRYYLRLNQEAPENFCRPSVNPMFKSLTQEFGASVLGVILTGMGHDGLEGSKIIVDGGGTIIAQDEETSVVWGMPGAVSEAGICSAVMPIDQLASKAQRIVQGDR